MPPDTNIRNLVDCVSEEPRAAAAGVNSINLGPLQPPNDQDRLLH